MFSRKKQLRLTDGDYTDRFRELRVKWPDPFIDNAASVQETLVVATGVLSAIFDRNGGAGWDESADQEYLDLLGEHLLEFEFFDAEEKKAIIWSLEEILECGRELERDGESARDASKALDILKCRVVDWILAHPEEIQLKDDEYFGHD
jgi:hypothetical protein